jgi:hypothetical protein
MAVEATPAIPDGFRRLAVGEVIRPGDRSWIPRLGWRPCDGLHDGTRVLDTDWRWLFVRPSSPDAGRGDAAASGEEG